MRTSKWVAGVILGTFMVTGCGQDSVSTANSGKNTGNATQPGAFPVAGEALFSDSFPDDGNGWGMIDHPDFGTAAYQAGDYVWKLRGRVAHLTPEVLGKKYDSGQLDMRNVVVRADATIEKGGGVIAVSCRETPDTDAEFQWYEFVARDGYAAIRRADDKSHINVLAKTDKVSLPAGKPIKIEAACIDRAGGKVGLSLALNGAHVLQAIDSNPLGNGVPGVGAWTYPIHKQMDIRWHEFSIHRPKA